MSNEEAICGREIKHVPIHQQIQRIDQVIQRIEELNSKIAGVPMSTAPTAPEEKSGPAIGGLGTGLGAIAMPIPSLQDFLETGSEQICSKINTLLDLLAETEQRLF